MLKDDASGAVKIFRQTSCTGTGMPLPREPYSARHNKKFIATQNTAMRKNVTREIMRNSRWRQIDNLADAHMRRLQTGISGEQRVEAHAKFARDGSRRFTGCDGVRAGFWQRRI